MRCFLLMVISLALSVSLPAAEEAPATKRVEPAVVTLNGAMPLDKALAALQEQSGNRIVDLRERLGQPMTNPTLQLQLSKRPFWEALDAVAQRADVNVTPHTGEAAVGIVKGPHRKLPLSYSGPFWISVKELIARRHLEDESLSHLDLVLSLCWEPRVQPIMLRVEPNSVKATGRKGELEEAPQAGGGNIRLMGLPTKDLTLRLPLPARGVAALKKVEGQLTVLVPPEILEFRFDKAITGASQTRQGVAVKLLNVEKTRGSWAVHVELKYPPKSFDLESHESWAVDNEIYLEKNGTRVRRKDHRISVQEDGPIQVSYYFDPEKGAELRDYAVVYRAPAVPVRYPVTFRFTDVPLP